MRIYKILTLLLPALLFVACFEDDTTNGNRILSEITIEGGIDSIYNIDKQETLRIVPVISQKNVEKPLSYTWEIELVPYSNDAEFVYVGEKLGSFNCRLIVENEDGKAFFPFKLNVNSPYEEGITVLSKDADGRPMLSFMQTPLNPDEEAHFTEGDCLSLNNSDIFFSSHPADIVQTSGSLIFTCRGSGEGNDIPAVYYLNEKTLVVENMFTGPEYPDYKPVKLLVPSTGSVGAAYPILCDNGRVYEFSTAEAAIQPSRKLFYTYSPASFVVDQGVGYYYDVVLWDNDIDALASIYNGYGPYYFSHTYHLGRDDENFAQGNYFTGKKLSAMLPVRSTKEQMKLNGNEAVVIVNNGVMLYSLVIGTSFWAYNYELAENYLMDNGGFKMVGFGKSPIDENTPCIANKTYYSLLFADGNKVRRWNYTTSQLLTAAEELLAVGSDDAIITGFEISDDHLQTYVSFYEPLRDGLNGSVWVFDTDNGTVLKKYDNVCYRPVKMFYKRK